MADTEILSNESEQTLIFVYGTLKKDFPNYYLFEELISQKKATYLGPCMTHQPHPLVIGPYRIPYLLHLPGSGRRVKGELYSVSTQGLDRLDELEGTSVGHYERRAIAVRAMIMQGKKSRPMGIQDGETEEGRVDLMDAEAYFAHRSCGERMWERCGGVGLDEYSEALDYVPKSERAQNRSFPDENESFLSNHST